MESAKVMLHKASEAMQHEHGELMQRLQALDQALDALVCYSEVYADLSSCSDLVREGRWLSGWLPGHFVREEETVLASMARLGPEDAAFVRDIRRQHQEIGKGAAAFSDAADRLGRSEDLQQSICDLKEEGKRLTSTMAAHMGAEERKLAAVK